MVSVDGTEWTNTGITLGAGLSLISDVNVEDDYVEFILNGNAGSFQVKRVTSSNANSSAERPFSSMRR